MPETVHKKIDFSDRLLRKVQNKEETVVRQSCVLHNGKIPF